MTTKAVSSSVIETMWRLTRRFATSPYRSTSIPTSTRAASCCFLNTTTTCYSPPAGAAAVFSASLLHEAAPVTKGSRYVLLSFLGSAAGQTRLRMAASAHR